MRALRLDQGKLRFVADHPAPKPGPGECRVRVTCAGVCATDLALTRGYMDYAGTLGHEFCGVALDGPLAGRRVVGEINAACGSCAACAAGDGRHCPARSVLGILGRDGAFADELCLPATNLHAVPEGVSDSAATFTEPLAAAFEIPAQLDLACLARGTEPARALVVGDGRLGLLCAQVLELEGLAVELFGRHPERAERLPRLAWCDAPQPAGYDLVVEASGHPQLLARALGWVRPRGVLVLKTTSEAPAALDLAPLVVHEVTLLGSRCGPFEPALAALAAGRVLVEPLVDARFPLEDGERALREAARSGVLKVLLDIGGGDA